MSEPYDKVLSTDMGARYKAIKAKGYAIDTRAIDVCLIKGGYAQRFGSIREAIEHAETLIRERDE